MKDIKVVIPLKTDSDRIPNKNLRPFINGKSLFDIKAEQLLKVFPASSIYVSSENPEAEEVVKKYGFNFHLRSAELHKKTHRSNWAELTEAIIKAIPGESDILWVQVTQPLFDDFEKIMEIYKNLDDRYDSVVAVKQHRHHLLDERGNPVNFTFGYWHKISQDLPKLYEVAWAAFVMRREMMDAGAFYQIGRNPYLYEITKPMVDIDYMDDFEIAAILYERYMNR